MIGQICQLNWKSFEFKEIWSNYNNKVSNVSGVTYYISTYEAKARSHSINRSSLFHTNSIIIIIIQLHKL